MIDIGKKLALTAVISFFVPFCPLLLITLVSGRNPFAPENVSFAFGLPAACAFFMSLVLAAGHVAHQVQLSKYHAIEFPDPAVSEEKQARFYREMQPFFERGLIRELILTDSYCLCEGVSHSYFCFFYVMENKDPYQVGLLTDTQTVRSLVKQENQVIVLLEFIAGTNKKQIHSRSIIFNDKMLQEMQRVRQALREGKTTPFVDPALNARLRWAFLQEKQQRAKTGAEPTVDPFYADLRPFFEDGLLTQVYRTGRLCVCEAANLCYYAFPDIKTDGWQTGFVLKPEAIRKIIDEGEDFFVRSVNAASPEQLRAAAQVFNEAQFCELYVKRHNKALGKTAAGTDPALGEALRQKGDPARFVREDPAETRGEQEREKEQ